MNNQKQQEGIERTKVTRDPARTTAEWVSLVISLTILIMLIGLLLYAFLKDEDRPPVIEVQPQLEQVRRESGSFYLPVEVENLGSQTAEDVSIQMTLSNENAHMEAVTFNIAYLSGGETVNRVVIFQQDPSTSELVATISFLGP